MALLRLFLLLSTVLACASSSPIAPSGTSEARAGSRTGLAQAPASPTPPSSTDGDARAVKPILDRREPLNLGQPPALSPVDTVIIHPLPTQGCTTTVSETYGYPCDWDGTETLYPSTTIAFRPVNCNGCAHIHVHKDWYFCPNQRINGTARVGYPSTYWSTICSPPSTAVRLQAELEDHTPATTTPSDAAAAQTAVPVSHPAVTAS